MSWKQRAFGAVVCLGMISATAQANNLPKIEEFYFDTDSAAAKVVAVKADGEQAIAALMKQRELGRKAEEATSQLARIAVAQGRTELGLKLHEEAVAATSPNSMLGRMVRWNYAWDLFRTGQVEKALGHWRMVEQGSRGNPAWVPPTYAVALWTLGQKEDAVRWYAAAVRTEPQLWNRAENLASLLPEWGAAELEALAQVHAQWSAAPPSWP